jgi:phage FluMu protein Com
MLDQLREKLLRISPEEREDIVVDIIRKTFDVQQKMLDGELPPPTPEEKKIVDDMVRGVELYISLEGEEWLKEKGLTRPQKKVVNGVYIELACPRCKCFAVYYVERGVDSVIDCRSCKGKMRIRKEKFTEA